MTTHTVQSLVAWFLANDAGLRDPKARKERSRLLHLFCDFQASDGRVMGETPLSEIIGAHLLEFLTSQPGMRSQWTRRRCSLTIKRPFQEAERMGFIDRMPFRGIRERPGGRGRDLTPDEYRAFLRHATPEMRRVLFFLRLTGARPIELRRLEWHHINFDARVIQQREHKTFHVTGRERQIYLTDRVVRLLRWIKNRAVPRSPFVFTNTAGRPWTTRALCQNVAFIKERAGIAADAKLYGCRHSFATSAVINGVDVATIAQLLGHNSLQSSNIYIHLAGKRDHLAAAVEKAVTGTADAVADIPVENAQPRPARRQNGKLKAAAMAALVDPEQLKAIVLEVLKKGLAE